MLNWEMILMFLLIGCAVSALGFWAARWVPGDLTRLQEWGIAGRRFGTVVSWFLLGGDIYTAYSFMAVPGLIFSAGALGFFAVPYLILIYPLVFLILPRFWAVARHRGYLTPADFVRERFGSRSVGLLVAVTGILATMPYIALQMLGIQIVLSQMGLPVELSLVIAFLLLAAYTYVSGLRAPALIAIVKDSMIVLVVIVAFLTIPGRLGGFAHIFAAVPRNRLLLAPSQYSEYATLTIGSALALFLYPHTLTGVLSTNSRTVVRRNAALLPAYSLLIGLIGLLGYMALAAGIHPSAAYRTNSALPALFAQMFPGWFAGFAFAALCIGALVPASVMSIASANLFTRNIYREFFRPTCSDHEEARVAKTASLVVKIGALAFILFFPTELAINLQLLSNIWIVQTLPAVFLGLYTTWFHRRALMIGWVAGMVTGTGMMLALHFSSSVFPLTILGATIPVYAAVAALVVNLGVSVALSPLYRLAGVSGGEDFTAPTDYEASPVQAAKLRQAAGGLNVQVAELVDRRPIHPEPVAAPFPGSLALPDAANGSTQAGARVFSPTWTRPLVSHPDGAGGDNESERET
jgi:SSS family solute:Na+ symporter